MRKSRRQLCIEPLECRTVPAFLTARSYDVGLTPFDVTAIDLTSDGIPDLAAANLDTFDVTVLVGNGDGSYQPATRVLLGGRRGVSLIGADFNLDGWNDLAVGTGNGSPNSVALLFGNGDGTFAPLVSVTLPAYPTDTLAADMNLDGAPDLVFGSGSGASIMVLLNHGDGTFGPVRTVAAANGCRSVAVADFNADGIPDVATGNQSSNSLSILLGNGDGTFEAPRHRAVQAGPTDVAAGDLNGDGLPDLVLSTSGTEVAVFFGNGDGTAAVGPRYAIGNFTRAVAILDANQDGVQDVAAVYLNAGVVLLTGLGDGTFALTGRYAAGSNPDRLSTADLNLDGRLDLIVNNQSSRNTTVLLDQGDGTFQGPAFFPAGNDSSSAALGDINGDGLPDVLIGNRVGRTASVLVANGDGTFQPPVNTPLPERSMTQTVADLNLDGILDLVTTYGSLHPLTVALGNGDGSFGPRDPLPLPFSAFAAALGDLNFDGVPDLVVGGNPTVGDSLAVLLGNGDGTFQPPTGYSGGPQPRALRMADVNNDGVPDLVVANNGNIGSGANASLITLLGNGDGTFGTRSVLVTGSDGRELAVGDFDFDGLLDAAVLHTANVRVALGNGDGTFRLGETYGGEHLPYSLLLDDWNLDGIWDLASTSRGGMRVRLGNGDGTFRQDNVRYADGPFAELGVSADFNSDGWPDVVVATSNGASLLLNDGYWPAAPAPGFFDPGFLPHPQVPARAMDTDPMPRPSPRLPPLDSRVDLATAYDQRGKVLRQSWYFDWSSPEPLREADAASPGVRDRP